MRSRKTRRRSPRRTASVRIRMRCAEAQRALKLPHGRRRLSVRTQNHGNSRPASGLQKKGNLDANNCRTGIAEHIKQAIIEQERLGLDVLVQRSRAKLIYGGNTSASIWTASSLPEWLVQKLYGFPAVLKPPVVIGVISRRHRLPWSGRNMLDR